MSLPLWLFHTKGRILRGELFEVESIWRLRCHDLEPGVVVHTCSLRRGNSRIRSSRTALVFHIDSEINLVSHENSLKNINMSIVPLPPPQRYFKILIHPDSDFSSVLCDEHWCRFQQGCHGVSQLLLDIGCCSCAPCLNLIVREQYGG